MSRKKKVLGVALEKGRGKIKGVRIGNAGKLDN